MYSYELLSKMKGQSVKDIWHSMIGKEEGIRNTTGLKTMEDVIQAILKGQEDSGFLEQFREKRTPKHSVVEKEEESMGRTKQKHTNPIVVSSSVKKTVEAVESNELPFQTEVKHVVVKKLIVGNLEYFKDKETNEVYSVDNGKPGQRLGVWNSATRSIVQA